MNQENYCESPMGGYFAHCQKTDKNGYYIGMGIGKAKYNVSYYLKDDTSQDVYTYQMCKDCTKEYEIKQMCPDIGDEIVTEIEVKN